MAERTRIQLQLDALQSRAAESLRVSLEDNETIEQGLGLLDSLNIGLTNIGRLEAQEASIRILAYLLFARTTTAHLLAVGGLPSESYEILRSAFECLAQQHLFVSDPDAVEEWLGGKEIGTRRILKAVEEVGFGKLWATLAKHAHPTLRAVGASAKNENGVWFFDVGGSTSSDDLAVAFHAIAALVEREIQLLASVFGARLTETVDEARDFQKRFAAFRENLEAMTPLRNADDPVSSPMTS